MAQQDPEVWMPVPSVLGLEASSWGRLRLTPYLGTMPNGGVRMYGGQARTGSWDPKTQRYVLRFKGLGRSFRVAPLVCEAFNGPKPFPEAVCMHDDEDSRNNRPPNLKWGTTRENLNYPGCKAKMCARTGERSSVHIGRRRREEQGANP